VAGLIAVMGYGFLLCFGFSNVMIFFEPPGLLWNMVWLWKFGGVSVVGHFTPSHNAGDRYISTYR